VVNGLVYIGGRVDWDWSFGPSQKLLYFYVFVKYVFSTTKGIELKYVGHNNYCILLYDSSVCDDPCLRNYIKFCPNFV
jgi:hypothetical protein